MERGKEGKMSKVNFHLCGTGWNLYLAWASSIEDKLEDEAIAELKHDYYNHRVGCDECTKPGAFFGKDEDGNEDAL